MSRNPWLLQTGEPEWTVQGSRAGAVTLSPLVGAPGPQRGVAVPEVTDQLTMVQHTVASDLWCMSTHGGAGESTLSQLIPGWRAAGHGWPTVPASYSPTRVVLLARSSAAGLRAAQNAARQWASGAVPLVDLVGLVVVADAPGRLPRPLRELATLVSGGVPRSWYLPWVEAWRLGDDVTLDGAPRDVRRVVSELVALIPTQGPAAGGAH